MTEQLYHLPNIRDLLINGFDDLDLRTLCFDMPDFRPVYERLAQGTGKAQIVAELIEYADKTLQIDTLLALAKERNSRRYELHGPYYVTNPTPILQKQVSDLAKRLTTMSFPSFPTREQQYQIALNWVKPGRKDSLKGFDLRETDLRAVDLPRADLRLVDLSLAKLAAANLLNADLRLANLSRADLSTSSLWGANLTGANLTGANLTEANLTNAQLYGADLAEANLTGVKVSYPNLTQAKSLEGAIMPDGTVHE